ncbi:MAG: cytidylate kinase-like family protein [Oscillospiraceae bacterium]|nr:cytidylate kinase-like family protein [Candidatus Equicaccousia limihippi]
MNKIICIERQFASGGTDIGRIVSERLGIPFYDKEIINQIAKENGMSEEMINSYDEKPTNSFLYSLSLGAFSYGGAHNGIPEMPLSDKIYVAQNDIIKGIADKGPCVIIGRCANSILKDNYDLLTVFVHASTEYKIERLMRLKGYDRNAAVAELRKTDKKRSSYNNYYADVKWGDVKSYDLCLNSELGFEKCADIICSALDK